MWRIHLKGVAYTSKGSGVYVIWGWRIRPMGVAYTSNGGGVYVQWTYTSKGPKFLSQDTCTVKIKMLVSHMLCFLNVIIS